MLHCIAIYWQLNAVENFTQTVTMQQYFKIASGVLIGYFLDQSTAYCLIAFILFHVMIL